MLRFEKLIRKDIQKSRALYILVSKCVCIKWFWWV